jgi:hypothetical protein
VCAAKAGRSRLVKEFVDEHAWEPQAHTCFLPIELLMTTDAIALPDTQLLPAGAVTVPGHVLAFDPSVANQSVISVACQGTSWKKMIARSRAAAEHDLRLVRATLAQGREFRDTRLRFRLGSTAWLDDDSTTWTYLDVEGLQISDEPFRALASSQPVSTLSYVSRNDAERRGALALRWFEKAQLEDDPVSKLLYLFFALEAILGDRGGALNAANLAVRRAMLSLLTTGQCVHPARAFFLYEEVRSAAVHGEEPMPIGVAEADKFAADIRRAISEFLQYAAGEKLTRRKQVRQALLRHKKRAELVANLRARDPARWADLEQVVVPATAPPAEDTIPLPGAIDAEPSAREVGGSTRSAVQPRGPCCAGRCFQRVAVRPCRYAPRGRARGVRAPVVCSGGW